MSITDQNTAMAVVLSHYILTQYWCWDITGDDTLNIITQFRLARLITQIRLEIVHRWTAPIYSGPFRETSVPDTVCYPGWRRSFTGLAPP
jgi:hypothetical protein